MINFINLTPHPITVFNESGGIIMTLPKCDNPLRLKESRIACDNSHEIFINTIQFEIGNDVPALENSLYVVSNITAQIMKRADFIFPYDVVRDDKGNIIGCKSFARVA